MKSNINENDNEIISRKMKRKRKRKYRKENDEETAKVMKDSGVAKESVAKEKKNMKENEKRSM